MIKRTCLHCQFEAVGVPCEAPRVETHCGNLWVIWLMRLPHDRVPNVNVQMAEDCPCYKKRKRK